MKKFLILLSTLFYITSVSAVFAGEERRIVVFGDSLSAGFDLAQGDSFPGQLQKAYKDKNQAVFFENAGVSGDTSAGGLARLDWSVPSNTLGVILQLGANDALRAVPLEETRKNLDEILTKLKARKIQVLLIGMEAPRNMGEPYVSQFRQMYQDLAKKHDTVFYPFFLDGVAMNPKLNLADGMHPNAEGISIIVKNILPKVDELISRLEKK